MLFEIFVLGIITTSFQAAVEASYSNFDVKRFEVCNNTQREIKYQGNIIREHGNQFLTFHINSPIPWDENLGFECLIQTKTIGNIFVELFTIREKSICKAFNKYLGEFWYDIERAAQIIPAGVCPIREGSYHAHHTRLDFTKISLQTFPPGELRFTMKAVDNKRAHNIKWCLLVDVENVID